MHASLNVVENFPKHKPFNSISSASTELNLETGRERGGKSVQCVREKAGNGALWEKRRETVHCGRKGGTVSGDLEYQ